MDHSVFFSSGSVIWNLESTNKFDAIREVIHNTPVFRSVSGLDLAALENAVITRENLQSTGFGHGVAIAHGRVQVVNEPRIALGISREGIEFESVDSRPVHLLFVVATHPGMPMDYLRILSSLVSLVRNDLFRSELLRCSCTEDIEQMMCGAFRNAILRVEGRNAQDYRRGADESWTGLAAAT